MTKLVIERSKSYLGRKQAYKIWIDGKNIGKIKDNETIELDVAAGTHTIQVGVNKMSGMSKVEYFEGVDNQTIDYNIDRPHIGSILFIVAILLAAVAGVNVSTGRFVIVFILLIVMLAVIAIAGKFLIRLNRIS
ncbi:DUF2846 domain-containing protein [Bartonella sp. HY329]|uniref:DUF2846 domain-containing protein n=1 Tax=unclassified Bartonella TaxID=2645622 RepID=UPI0021C7EFED|nr:MULTISPECIES: DUF2846 domain-containing protein [unclassified Bartonella]UXM96009.1 DUF2846 domain-containing protein [Bartonella sp. HY329]UXN10334.1 DUF2846 domain-containing protein [Bartonella sp. HY328]